MPKRQIDISLAPKDLKKLAKDLEFCFRQHIITSEKFRISREAKIYKLLRRDILKFTGSDIGFTSLIQTMTLTRTRPFRPDILDAFKKYITAIKITLKSPSAIGGQKIFWGVNQGMNAGAFVNDINGEFIPWEQLKQEIEERAIIQCPRKIPVGSFIEKFSFYGKEDWVINIKSKEGRIIGSVWIGGNPAKNFEQDGFIRIGKTESDTKWEVYQVIARFPDSSYRLIKSFV
jgi:hypothetical protein